MACGLQPTTQILIDDFASGRKLFFSQRIGKELDWNDNNNDNNNNCRKRAKEAKYRQ